MIKRVILTLISVFFLLKVVFAFEIPVYDIGKEKLQLCGVLKANKTQQHFLCNKIKYCKLHQINKTI